VSSTSSLPAVPLDDDDYWQDPYPILNELRDRHGTAVTPEGVKVLLRWSDAESLKTHPHVINEGLEYIEQRGFKPGDALYEWRRYSIGARNGEDHRRLRSLVSRAITPRSADRLRPLVRAQTRKVLADHADRGELDGRSAFRHVPFLGIVEFLGIDVDEAMTMAATLADGAADAFGPNVTPQIRAAANATFAKLMEFVDGLVEQRRREPRDDLLTRLIEAEEEGHRLSHDELIVLFTNIFGGAVESTSSVMTSTLLELCRHPDQAALLRADPDGLKRGAAEEVLRHRPGFYAIGKKVDAPTTVGGLAFAAGEALSVLVGGPNRDAARWRDPDRFDITRDPNIWSYTFSVGPHFCLGQAIARTELQEFAATIASNCVDLELIGEPRWKPRVMVNAVEALPLRYRFEPRPDSRNDLGESR